MKYKFLIVIFILPIIGKAQNLDTIPKSKLVLELALFDLPYQFDAAKTVNKGNLNFGSFFKGYSNPSMHQSLDLATDLYTGLHYGVNKIFNLENSSDLKKRNYFTQALYGLTLCGSDYLSLYAPGFDGWEHEEYHRAIMTRFHVNSFNDMNRFPLGAETVSVEHVTDEDLIRFKDQSPADFVRMQAAGIEGEYLLVEKLQRNNFFYNQNLPHELIYWFVTLSSISYVQACSDPSEADTETEQANAKENTIAERDFTGLDFLGWTYDLFRPDEPYTERGTHPSGNGINRYIKTTDLTDEELAYLKKQGNLQWLNIISPMMVGCRSIKLSNKGLYGNFSVRDYLTSFGNDISCTIFLMNPKNKFVFAYHSYQNYHSYFPAIEAQMKDWKQEIFHHLFYISPRVIVGLQPENQQFKTNNSEFLGLEECKLEMKMKNYIQPYLEFCAKTKGWVAGNEYLDSNVSFRFGIISRLDMKNR